MVFYLKLYALSATLFLALDLIWLGIVARPFYQQHLGHLLKQQVDWAAAISFYLIYIGGILLFAVVPGLAADSLKKTAMWAAAFGFFTYITYELTNRATLPEWPLVVVFVDTLWGVTLCTVVGIAAHLMGRRSSILLR